MLSTLGGRFGKVDWLARGEAVDIFFDGCSPHEVQSRLGETLAGLEIDALAQSGNLRKKQMLAADMDITIIEIECIDELAGAMNVRDKIAPITEAAMRGEIDFAEALKARVRLLAGLDFGEMERLRAEKLTYSPGARQLVATMSGNGAVTLLVSGSFTFFAEYVADELGFGEARANSLEIRDGKLTGRLSGKILGAREKRQALAEVREEAGLEPSAVLAVGDGANDLLMLAEAGLGIAYKGKPATAEAADGRIDHTGLETLLYYQGYRRSEFIG